MLLGLVVLASLFAPVLTSYDPDQAELQPAPLPAVGPRRHARASPGHGQSRPGHPRAPALRGTRLARPRRGRGGHRGDWSGVVVGLAASWSGAPRTPSSCAWPTCSSRFPSSCSPSPSWRWSAPTRSRSVGVLALSGWVLYARTIRAHVLTIRGLDYIDAAAHARGQRHCASSCNTSCPTRWRPILVIGSSQFATMVLLESGLSFLGLGVQAPAALVGLHARGRARLSLQRVVAGRPSPGIDDLARRARGESARRRAARSPRPHPPQCRG